MSAWMRRRDIAALALTTLAAPRTAFAAANLAASPQPPAPQSSEHEAVLDRMRRLTVDVRINGDGPFRFFVDTGANQSAISSELAERLRLPTGSFAVVQGIAGARLAPTVTAERVQVGGRGRRRMRLSVLDGQAIQADGLLGVEWLDNQRLTFDFERSRLRIEPALRRRKPDVGDVSWQDGEGRVVVGARLASGRLSLIRAAVGGEPVTVFVDSGSYCTIGNPVLYGLAAERGAVGAEWGNAEIVGVTGDVLIGRLATLKSFKLGGMRLRNLPVVFAPVHTFRFWGVDHQPMLLIGMDVLRVFDAVSLDFANRQVAFQPRRS